MQDVYEHGRCRIVVLVLLDSSKRDNTNGPQLRLLRGVNQGFSSFTNALLSSGINWSTYLLSSSRADLESAIKPIKFAQARLCCFVHAEACVLCDLHWSTARVLLNKGPGLFVGCVTSSNSNIFHCLYSSLIVINE